MAWTKTLGAKTLGAKTSGTKTFGAKTLGAVAATAILATAGSFGLAACAHTDGKAPAEKKEKKAPEPKPAAFCAVMDRIGLLAATTPGRVVVTGETASVTLLPACGPPFLPQRVTSSTAKRFILLFDDLRVQKPVGATFTLNFAEGGGAELTNDASTIGTLNVLAAAGPEAKGAPRRLSFDVTKTVRAMSDASHFEHMVIVLKPSTPLPAGSEFSVGRIQIVEQ